MNYSGKNVVVFGVASNTSIAYAIASAMQKQGANIHLGHQQKFKARFKRTMKEAIEKGDFTEENLSYDVCDLTIPEQVESFYANAFGGEGKIDVIVHSCAWADPKTFLQNTRDTTAGQWQATMAASAYSLFPCVAGAAGRLSANSSVMTMTYLGGDRVVQNYKLMGIAKAALQASMRELAVDMGPQGVRVNAISAGPVRTIASSFIDGFDEMMTHYAAVSPMRREVTQQDVANLALFLGSDMSSGITGQTIYVDSGFSVLAMSKPE